MLKQAYRYLGSIKLGAPLLAIIAAILIIATFYETQVGSATVQREIYKSAWFGMLMFLLALNLGISAYNRYPWKGTRKLGFAITHIGLIIIIAGSAAVIHLSVEGMLLVRTDGGAQNTIRVEGDLLETIDNAGKQQQTELFIKPDGSVVPDSLGNLQLVGYQEKTTEKVSFTEGALVENPAVHLSLHSNRMAQDFDYWLAVAPSAYSKTDLGVAELEIITAKDASQLQTLLTEPDSTAITKWRSFAAIAPLGTLQVTTEAGKEILDVQSSLNKEIDLGENIKLEINDFWANFRLDAQNQPFSASSQLLNPALQLQLTTPTSKEKWFVFGNDTFAPIRSTIAGDPVADVQISYAIAPPRAQDNFQVIVAPDHNLFYTAQSSHGFQQGELIPGKPVRPGWADFEITLEEIVNRGKIARQIVPVANPNAPGNPALQVLTPDGSSHWLPWGTPTAMDTDAGEYFAAFNPRVVQLPFNVQLEDFIVERNEGSQSVAMWTSKIQLTDGHNRETVHRDVWMNHPTWFRGWKIAQASWNPGDLRQSTLQIKREPWWVTALTWSGSLLVVLGITTMFYGKAVFK